MDLSFVRGIIWDTNSRAIVHTFIAVANHLDLALIAEGVETDAERQALFELGCKNYQGYYFSRPIDAESLLSLVGKQIAFPTLVVEGID